MTAAAELDLVRALVAAENAGDRREIVIGPFTAFVAVGALQLAWRHPQMNGRTGATIRDLGEQLSVLLGPEVQVLLAKGWDRAHDVEPDGTS